MSRWDWVTTKVFDEALVAFVQEEGVEVLLSVPGVYEAVSDHFHNAILEKAAEMQGRDPATGLPLCPECGEYVPHCGCGGIEGGGTRG